MRCVDPWAVLLAIAVLTPVTLATEPIDPSVMTLPAEVEMDLPIEPDSLSDDGKGATRIQGDALLGRLFVLIAPSEMGPAAIVAFDVPVDGPPVQRETYETSITGDSAWGIQEPALDALGRFLFVPGGMGDNIAVFALAGDDTISEIPESPFPADFGSFQLAVHPSGEYLYSSDGLRGVHAFRIGDGGVLEQIDKPSARSTRDLELTPDGGLLYVAEGFYGMRGFAVETDGTLTELASSPFSFTPSSRPFEIETSSDGQLLFVHDLDLGVSAFEIEDSGDLSRVPGSPFPVGEFAKTTRLTSDDAYLYVSSAKGPRIHAFRVDPGGVLTRLDGSPFPGGRSAIEFLELPERNTMFEISRDNQILIYEILDNGQLLQDPPPAFLVDGLGRTPIGAVFAPAAGNSPPVADAGEDSASECSDPDGASVLLDGSGSTDPDSSPDTNDDIILFEWFEGFGTPDERFLGEGETIEVMLCVGDHAITLRVTDRAGATATVGVTKTVADTTPPDLRVSLEPDTIWPPSHRMVDVHAIVEASDACGPATFKLSAVESDEPADGTGDGSFAPDVDGVGLGTPDVDFRLRAERSGSGPGRTYTIRYVATDGSGNETIAAAECVVVHDQGAN
jgi:6-phosphogluconolactonase (cycloisomerase 2 family)